MLELKEVHRNILCGILSRYLNGREVHAFGSRVDGTAKPYSDLDLVVMGKEPLSDEISGNLKEALEECDLPFQVDIIDWAITSNEFRSIISRSAVPFEYLLNVETKS